MKNEAALSRILQVDQSILSKVRHRRAPVTAGLLLRMHVRTKVPLGFLFKWLGVSAL